MSQAEESVWQNVHIGLGHFFTHSHTDSDRIAAEPSSSNSSSNVHLEAGPAAKRKLFSKSSLGHLRANLRKSGRVDHVVEESMASSPQLAQLGVVRALTLPVGLSSAVSTGDLTTLVQRTASLPAGIAAPGRLPLNVQYPSLKGLKVLRTLGAVMPPHSLCQCMPPVFPNAVPDHQKARLVHAQAQAPLGACAWCAARPPGSTWR